MLGVGLTTLALSLSQCQMVEERLTGVSLGAAKPAQCFSLCAQAYVASKALEIDNHQAIVQACAGDTVCLALEDIRFEEALKLLRIAQKDCQAKCHHQGGGSGG